MTEHTPPETRPGRGHTVVRVIVIVAVLIGLVVLAAVVADPILRGGAEQNARDQILRSLPEGTTGDVSVSIGGGPFLLQVLGGRMAEVTITGQDLVVSGVPVEGTVRASGVPTDAQAPVENIHFEVTVPSRAIGALAQVPAAASIGLGDGVVYYDGSVGVLGLPVPFRVEAALKLDGQRVVVSPSSVGIPGTGASLDLDAIGDRFRYSVCAAEYLPEGTTLEDITVQAAGVTVTGSAHNLVLSEETLRTHGSC